MKYFFILLTLLLPAISHALSLDEVIADVSRAHPAIKEAAQDAKESKSRKHAESWLPDPKGSIEFYEIPLSNKNLGNAAERNYSISQEIPFPGALIQRSRALDAEYKSKLAMVTGTQRLKTFEAKQAYFDLFATKKQIASIENSLGSYKLIISSLEEKYKSQSISDPSPRTMPDKETANDMDASALSDTLMAKMKKQELESMLHDLHHKQGALEARLNLMMGRDPKTVITELKEPQAKILKADETTLENKLVHQNSDIQSLGWMKTKAKREITLAAEKLIPTLEPQFTYNQRQNMQNAYTVGLSFNLPIWINRNAAEINAAKAQARKASYAQESKILELKDQFYYLYNHAKWHQQIVHDYSSKIIPLAESARNIALTAYQAGQINTVNMMQKMILYEEARKTYWDMWRDYQTEYALLEQLVGEDL